MVRMKLLFCLHNTKSSDPIFFLHHAQLDRLWGLWQQVQPNNRTFENTGHHMLNSTGNASLKDRLFMDTLAVDVSVEDVMSIQGKDLCYDYF
jgi:tyrosinase